MLFVCLPPSVTAHTKNVPSDDYLTIQAAIEDAETGDVIIVAPGIYYENINFKGKAITVRSNDPNNLAVVALTIIDGDRRDRVVVFDNMEEEGTQLNGFTIRNGQFSLGGGIYCSGASPSIRNCIIEENSALSDYGAGGGIYCTRSSYPFYISSSPSISNCIIRENKANYSGGGISCSDSSPSFKNCIIEENEVLSDYSDYSIGGGVYFYSSSAYTAPSSMVNCLIQKNSAYFAGGGIYCYSSPLYIENCSIENNLVLSELGMGGGVCSSSSPDLIMTNTIVSGNIVKKYGGGIYCLDSSFIITHCTIIDNLSQGYGGGVYCNNSSPVITNSILWDDDPEEIYTTDETPVVSFCDVQQESGCYPGDNINEEPLFVDQANGNYNLNPNSFCIDGGDPNAPEIPSKDKNGNPRSINRPDMGAYEHMQIRFTIYPGLNLPPAINEDWANASNALDFYISQNVDIKKIQSYQADADLCATLGTSYGENFPLIPGKGLLLYAEQKRVINISSLPTSFSLEMLPGFNLVGYNYLHTILDIPIMEHRGWPTNLFEVINKKTGKTSSSILRYDAVKGKWQSIYPFFKKPAGQRAAIQMEGHGLYFFE